MTKCVATAIMRNIGSFARSCDAVWIMTDSSAQEAKVAHLVRADSSMIEWRQVYRNPCRLNCKDKRRVIHVQPVRATNQLVFAVAHERIMQAKTAATGALEVAITCNSNRTQVEGDIVAEELIIGGRVKGTIHGAFQNFVDVGRGAAVQIGETCGIGDQTPGVDEPLDCMCARRSHRPY